MGRMVNSSYWGRPKMTGPTSHVQVPASHVQRLAKRVPIGTLAMFVCQVRCGCVAGALGSQLNPWESLGSPLEYTHRETTRQAGRSLGFSAPKSTKTGLLYIYIYYIYIYILQYY